MEEGRSGSSCHGRDVKSLSLRLVVGVHLLTGMGENVEIVFL